MMTKERKLKFKNIVQRLIVVVLIISINVNLNCVYAKQTENTYDGIKLNDGTINDCMVKYNDPEMTRYAFGYSYQFSLTKGSDTIASFSEQEACDILEHIEIKNSSNGIYQSFTPEMYEITYWDEQKQESVSSGLYAIDIKFEIGDPAVGTTGSFTINCYGLEKVYFVRVVAEEDIMEGEGIRDAVYASVNSSPTTKKHFEKEPDGTELINWISVNSSDEFFIKLINYESEVIRSFDYSTASYTDFQNLEWYSEGQELQKDTVATIQITQYRGAEFPSVVISAVKRGDAFFTLHIGSYVQKFHIAIANPDRYPEKVILDQKSISVNTGESITVTASISEPQNPYYNDIGWLFLNKGDDGKEYPSEKCAGIKLIKSVENGSAKKTGTFIAWQPGVYKIVTSAEWQMPGSMFSNFILSDDICTVTVTGKEVEEPTQLCGIIQFLSDEKMKSEKLFLTVYDVDPHVTDIEAEIWCDTNGKDDCRIYPLEQNKDSVYQEWFVKDGIPIAQQHREAGMYFAYVYGNLNGVRTLIGTKKIEVVQCAASEEVSPSLEPGNMYHKGDVNLDDAVTAADALLVLKHAAKLTSLEDVLVLADMDNDKSLTAADALEILKVAAKMSADELIKL